MTELLKPTRTSRLWAPGGESRLWKRGDPSVLPRNGLVALYDPYRDAYGLAEVPRLALQTGVDYSGRGNTLTFGATTGASTDDPTNTGTAWSFDGGDFATAGRPAQLEVAQPWWGFGVWYLPADGTNGCLASKMNNSGTGAGTKGFILNKMNTNKIRLSAYKANSTRAVPETANALTEGWHWVSYGWNGTQATLNVDRVDATPVAITDFTPDTTYSLTFGKYAYSNAIYFTGSLALAGFYSRYPALSERMRMALYVKSLMAPRGVALA